MDNMFKVHKLNQDGLDIAELLGTKFEGLFSWIEKKCESDIDVRPTREINIVRSKLEEACFYAKKAIAQKKEFQE